MVLVPFLSGECVDVVANKFRQIRQIIKDRDMFVLFDITR